MWLTNSQKMVISVVLYRYQTSSPNTGNRMGAASGVKEILWEEVFLPKQ